MSKTVIQTELNIDSKGMDPAVNKAKTINSELKGAQAALKTAASAQNRTPAALQQVNSMPVTRGVTGQARSIGGEAGTGSDSRDFARQAVGLGGLVRVYATFAANIFAATAAFGALRRAADTSNLIKGLDQLGASSGRNLGGLAKELVAATGGAISLREAMSSVAKASSSGMSKDNILRLGNVAKMASQALGVEMTDAVSRLTRGITKLEPELLDEIGIFTRLDPAAAEYAKSVGKATTALTSFERRMAFANAVLKEGEDKFGAIKLDTNPYSQLSASVEDLTYKGLNLINMVLLPVANILASSPVALGAGLAGIIGILVKQAVPAISDWRRGIKAAAEDSEKAFTNFSESFGDEFQARLAARFKIPELENDLKSIESKVAASNKRLTNLAMPASLGKVKSVATFVAADAEAVSFDRVNRLIKEKSQLIETKMRGQKAATASEIEGAKQEVAYLEKIRAEKKAYIELLKQQKNATEALNSAEGLALSRADSQGRLDPETLLNKKADRLDRTRRQRSVISRVVDDTQILGVRDAMSGFSEKLDKEGIKGISRFTTFAKAGLASVATRVMGIASAFSHVALVAGIVTGAFIAIQAIFSKTAQEQKQFTASIDSANASAESLVATLEKISTLDPLSQVTVASIHARATALFDMSDSLKRVAVNLVNLRKAQQNSLFDRAVDSTMDFFGFGAADDVASAYGSDLSVALKAMDLGPAKQELETKLKQILGVTQLTKKAIEEALEDSDTQQSKVQALNKVLGESAIKFMSVADAGKRFADAMGNITTISQENTASLRSKTMEGKLAEEQINIYKELGEVIKSGPVNSMASMVELAGRLPTLATLGVDLATTVRSSAEEFKSLLSIMKNIDSETDNLNEQIAKLQSSVAGGINPTVNVEEYKKFEALQDRLNALGNAKTSLLERTGKATEMAMKVQAVSLQNAADNMLKAVSQASAVAALAKQQGEYGAIKSLTGSSDPKLEANLKAKAIDLQIKEIQSRYENTRALDRLTSTFAYQDKAGQLAKDPNNADLKQQVDSAGRVVQLVSLTTAELLREFKASASGSGRFNLKDFEPIMSTIMAAKGMEAATVGLSQQRNQALNIDLFVDLAKKEEADRKVLLNKAVENSELQKSIRDRLTNLYSFENGTNAPTTSKTIEDARASISSSEGYMTLTGEIKDLAIRVAKLNEVLNSGKIKDPDTRKFITSERDITAAELGRKSTFKDNMDSSLYIIEELLKKEEERLKLIDKASKFTLTQRENELSVTKEIFSEYSKYLSAVGANDTLSSSILSQERTIANQKLENEKGSELSKPSTIRTAIDTIALKRSITQEEVDLYAAAGAEIDRINSKYDEQGALINKVYNTKKRELELNTALTKQASFMSKLTDLIAGSFGKLASRISGVVSVFGDMTTNAIKFSKVNANITEDIREQREIADGAEEGSKKKTDALNNVNQLTKAQTAIVEENRKAEESYTLASISAVKNLFSEKSAAYKAMHALEVFIHASKLAMMLKENAAVIQSTLVKTAANAKEMISAAGTALMNAAKFPFPGNIAAIAITGAIVASILSTFGGGSKSIGMPSNSAQQDTQGTGETYNGMEKVSRGGGALGDRTAKADSIGKSLEIMKEHSFSMLEYDNKMLSHLSGIEKNTEGLSAILLQQGLNTKDATAGISVGKVEEGLLSDKSNSDILGTVGLLVGGVAGAIVGNIAGGLVDKIFGSSLGSIFGKGTFKEISANRLEIEGLISELGKAGASVGRFLTDVKVTKDGLFGKDSVSWETESRATGAMVSEALSNIFRGMIETVRDSADALGKSRTEIESVISAFKITDLKLNFTDLKPEEVTEALNAELGIIFNKLGEAAFPELNKFRKPAEEFGTVVIRLARQMEVTSLLMESIGKTVTYSTDMLERVAQNERFVEMAGGLDTLVDSIQSFSDMFLTESEILAPIQNRVAIEMERLGMAGIDTREKFALAFKSIDITSESGAQLAADMLKVSGAFAKVYPEIRKTISAAELLESKLEQQITIYELEGKALDALHASRVQELQAMDANLQPGQLYIYALEEERNLKDQILSAYEKEKGVLEELKSSLQTASENLQKFKKELLLGGLSTKTPTEKYQEAKDQATQIANIAAGLTGANESDVRRAIDELPSASSAMLEASRTIFASSAAYTQDFNWVQEILESTNASISTQLTDAQLQLEAMTAQVTALGLIEENTSKMSDYLAQLAELREPGGVLESLKSLARSVQLVVDTPPAFDDVADSIRELIREFAPRLAASSNNNSVANIDYAAIVNPIVDAINKTKDAIDTNTEVTVETSTQEGTKQIPTVPNRVSHFRDNYWYQQIQP